MVVVPQSWPRLKSKIKIKSVKDTKGAQVGAVMAMVKDSLIPTTRPAKSGAQAEAKRPIMTTANTTPIQAKICEGAKVKVAALGLGQKLRDLISGEVITGQPPAPPRNPWEPPAEPRTTFELSLAPHSYRAFAVER